MSASKKNGASAEAIFGSGARGDTDKVSDRDYLIVDDDVSRLRRRTVELAADGWSVASYTFDKLEALSSLGALFVQHLKDEAVIQRDEGQRLTRLLSSFSPKKCYASEILDNSMLAMLASYYPDCPNGRLWAADVLYVSLRNYGVLKLAEHGRFVFSYHGILNALADEGLIQRADISELLKLRLWKALYRSGENVPADKICLDTAHRILPEEVGIRNLSATEPRAILEHASPLNKRLSPYHRLRNIEKTLIAALAMDPALENTARYRDLKRRIENPRAYTHTITEIESSELIALKTALKKSFDRENRLRFFTG